MNATILGRLLRSPGEIATSCRENRDVRAIAGTSLIALALGAAVFGGVLGSFRGGEQIVFAAIKVPLALIATLALAAPAFHALAAALGRPWPMRSVVALALAAAGRSALVLLAFSPPLWLLLDWGINYHGAAVMASIAYGVSGLAALGVLVRGLEPGSGRFLTALGFVAVFFAVGGQTSWILRPYLVRPRTEGIPFARAREGGFADSLMTSSKSMFGIYDMANDYESGRVPARERR